MADIAHFGFLLDRDVVKATRFFPSKRTRTTLEMGLREDATDAQIVRVAWENQLIIVTGNGDDFTREILKYQKANQKKICHDMNGLIVLPNGFELQRHALRNIGKKLRFGGKLITWPDVWSKNLSVRVSRHGEIVVRPFPKCLYCRRVEQK